MDGSVKTTLWLAAGLTIVALLVCWHVRNLNAEIERLEGDLRDCREKVAQQEVAIVSHGAAMAAMKREADAMRERGRRAQQHAQEAIAGHRQAIARIRQERADSCSQEPLRQKLLNELLPGAPDA